MSDEHFGGCACGAVRYRVRGKPIVSSVCHCKFCQKRLASAFAVLAVFPEESVEVTQGDVTECEYRSDESGRWLRMRFCPKCGTTVSHTSQIRRGYRVVAVPTLDEQDWFDIDRHIWTRSKMPWVTIPEGLEDHAEAPPLPSQGKSDT
jgi:hypothetical protein